MSLLERLMARLGWERKRLPAPPSHFLKFILDDYDLHMLIQNELGAIRPNLHLLRPIIKQVYGEVGGHYDVVRLIVQIIGSKWIEVRLDQTDLPGPDAYIKPKVLEMSKDFIGKAFDDFFLDNPNATTSRTDN